jgi:hypothetical protein
LGTGAPLDQSAANVTGTMLLALDGAADAARSVVGLAQGEEEVPGHLYEGFVIGQELIALHGEVLQARR